MKETMYVIGVIGGVFLVVRMIIWDVVNIVMLVKKFDKYKTFYDRNNNSYKKNNKIPVGFRTEKELKEIENRMKEEVG